MSIDNGDDDYDNFFNEQLLQAQSLLQSPNKVFLQHDHTSGYLNPKSKWDGEYHLAHIAQSYDKSTHQALVTWEREGYSQTVPYTLSTPTQVKSAKEYVKNKMIVQIEDDFNGQIHSGTIVDLLDGSNISSGGDGIVRSGEIKIKWETGQKQIMCVSQVQVSVNIGRRKRRRTVSKSSNEIMMGNSKKAVSTTSKEMMDGRKQQCSDLSKTREKKKRQEVITVDSSSSSSSEDDEENGQYTGDRKQKWRAKKQTVHASSSSSSSSSDDAYPKPSGQKYDANNNEGHWDSNDEKSVGSTELKPERPNTIQVPRGGNPPRRTQASASAEATYTQSASSDGASPRGDKDDQYSDSSSSDESDVMSQRSLDTQEGAYESSTSWGQTFLGQTAEEERSADKLVKPPSKGVARGESNASSDSQSSSDDESEDEVNKEPRKMAAVQKNRTTTTTSQSSDEDNDDSKVGGRPHASGRKRKARDAAAAGYSNDVAGKISAKRVTRVTPKKQELSTKRDSLLLHGFCRSLPEIKKKPHGAIEIVQEVLDKALECKEDSDEFKETLIDANMLLQESLFHLGEQTHFVKAPPLTETATLNSSQNDGKNKDHIIRLGRKFGLSQRQIDDVMASVGIEDGYYSIDKIIPKIIELKTSNNNCSESVFNNSSESDREEENNSAKSVDDTLNGSATVEEKKRQLELLGSRVRSVFEDGGEYEGTISDVHYRVTYDDGDTETMSENEAFQNLACNDKLHIGPPCDDFRCNALELFSGCSLLSTLCKRKGMNVISVDNDLDSNATVKRDFASDYVQNLISSKTFDYIHASPDCRTYSRASGNTHRSVDNYNVSLQSHEADAMLLQLYFNISEQLRKNSNATVTIENPIGRMQKGSLMKDLFEGELGFERVFIHYCQFGRGDKKPTNLWTNDKVLGNILRRIGGKCNHVNHEEKVQEDRHKNFAALPMQLCELISSYISSKHTQLKFAKFASKNDHDGNSSMGDSV